MTKSLDELKAELEKANPTVPPEAWQHLYKAMMYDIIILETKDHAECKAAERGLEPALVAFYENGGLEKLKGGHWEAAIRTKLKEAYMAGAGAAS